MVFFYICIYFQKTLRIDNRALHVINWHNKIISTSIIPLPYLFKVATIYRRFIVVVYKDV